MDKTGKRVDVVRAVHDHPSKMYGLPEEEHIEDEVPYLFEVTVGNSAMHLMGKEVSAETPTHDCPDWARPDLPDDDSIVETEDGKRIAVDGGRKEYIYRYDESGDQVCVNCGDIRNQSSETVRDHQHSGRYDGFKTS